MSNLGRGLLALLVATLILSGAVQAQDDSQHMIGIVLSDEYSVQSAFDGFVEGMAELGYVEGETVGYVYFDAFPAEIDEATAAELTTTLNEVAVDLFVVAADRDALRVNQFVDHNPPIVVCFSLDAVGQGLAESLTEPGGNVTGIQNANYHARALQLLLEIDPTIQSVFFPYPTEVPESQLILQSLEEMAEVLEIDLVDTGILNAEEMTEAIQDLSEDMDAIYLPPDSTVIAPQTFFLLVQKAVQLQTRLAIPAAVPLPGVLMGYGPDTFVSGLQASGIVDRILRGADPATLPLENADYFLMVNLQTAQNLDLEVPRSVLRQAEIIIRPGDTVEMDLPDSERDGESEGDD